MDVEYINYNEGNSLLDWLELVNAIESGHPVSYTHLTLPTIAGV